MGFPEHGATTHQIHHLASKYMVASHVDDQDLREEIIGIIKQYDQSRVSGVGDVGLEVSQICDDPTLFFEYLKYAQRPTLSITSDSHYEGEVYNNVGDLRE